MLSPRRLPLLLLLFCLLPNGIISAAPHRPHRSQHARRTSPRLTIEYNPGKPLNTFVPVKSIGGGIDGAEQGNIKRMLTPANILQMRGAGLQSLSYRLRTELGIEAWHWNPAGHWSEAPRQCGYWVSDSTSGRPINLSLGYNLPRRGSTFDQAENKGYSRIDDGDERSFWKSNPYLDSRFTGEDDSVHEQWIAVDLGRSRKVNQLEIDWADPFATDFRLEYANAESVSMFNHSDELDPYQPGLWKPVPISVFHELHGGKTVIRFTALPFSLRVLRIVFTRSSRTAAPGCRDPRDSCGYAIREIRLGLATPAGFTDYIRHGADNRSQSPVFASTTDPWHTAGDSDINIEQPGVDLVFSSGLTGSQPALFSAGLLYDVPENTLALAAYLRNKNYPLAGFELGEEPDGQYISPLDFTTLYIRAASALAKNDSALIIGGPSFEGLDDDDSVKTWPTKFIECLKQRSALGMLKFLSFEWYPLDDLCNPAQPQIAAQPYVFEDAVKKLYAGGLPVSIPVYITESGYSVLAAEPEVRMEGALVNADVTAKFFALGGSKIFIYGWEPATLLNEDSDCGGYGNLEFFGLRGDSIIFRTGLFYSTWLLTQKWAQPADVPLQIYAATCSLHNGEGYELVSAYPLHRPDGKWSVLLINRDSRHDYDIAPLVHNLAAGTSAPLSLKGDLYQFSGAQYRWSPNGVYGRPAKDEWPAHTQTANESSLHLPAYSLTVLVQR